jgi:hypothetical protein
MPASSNAPNAQPVAVNVFSGVEDDPLQPNISSVANDVLSHTTPAMAQPSSSSHTARGERATRSLGAVHEQLRQLIGLVERELSFCTDGISASGPVLNIAGRPGKVGPQTFSQPIAKPAGRPELEAASREMSRADPSQFSVRGFDAKHSVPAFFCARDNRSEWDF